MQTLSDSAVDAEEQANIALREVLERIPREAEYGPWWGTDEGLALLALIKKKLGTPIVRVVLNLYGAKYDADDVAHTAIDVLSRSSAAEAIRYANNPWGYLYIVLRRELITQVGPFLRADYEMETAEVPDPADAFVGRHTNMDAAVELTVKTLTPFTPVKRRKHLLDVTHYLAARSGERLSRSCSEVTQDTFLDQFKYSSVELRAITNVVLGSRPKYAETSVLAAFVNDSDWDPQRSESHQAALRRYQKRMNNSLVAGA